MYFHVEKDYEDYQDYHLILLLVKTSGASSENISSAVHLMMEVELSLTMAKVILLAGLRSPECFRSDLEQCLLLARAWDGVRPTICFFFRLYSGRRSHH